MSDIVRVYSTIFPVMLAGILNMVWCKFNFFAKINKPIDFGKVFFDGNRILGENKTFKGFVGMCFFGVFSTVLWGFICNLNGDLSENNLIYFYNENTITYNAIVGFFFGFMYALFELPNSFIKRRFHVKPGKQARGSLKILFTAIDQIDSVLGCLLVLSFLYPLNLKLFLLFILISALTHFVVNILLFIFRLRKNIF